jgi:hypothetical protein
MLQELPSDNLKIKRRVATVEECKKDLTLQLQLMFLAFYDALRMFDAEIGQTPPESRARAFEASLLNSKMIQAIQKHFPKNWKFGKYKRFLLNIQGYTILFKKLNGKNKPMNVKTSISVGIENQSQVSLFEGGHISIEPILIFGYRKSIVGKIHDPKLVYIDENEVRWTITENSIENDENGVISIVEPTKPVVLPIEKKKPQLKPTAKEKKASSNNE